MEEATPIVHSHQIPQTVAQIHRHCPANHPQVVFQSKSLDFSPPHQQNRTHPSRRFFLTKYWDIKTRTNWQPLAQILHCLLQLRVF